MSQKQWLSIQLFYVPVFFRVIFGMRLVMAVVFWLDIWRWHVALLSLILSNFINEYAGGESKRHGRDRKRHHKFCWICAVQKRGVSQDLWYHLQLSSETLPFWGSCHLRRQDNKNSFPWCPNHAVDMEEAYCMCGTRGVQANHPCPHCLVHKSKLYSLVEPATMRTQQEMKLIYEKVLTATGSAAEKLLKGVGLHLVEVRGMTTIFNCSNTSSKSEFLLENRKFRPLSCIFLWYVTCIWLWRMGEAPVATPVENCNVRSEETNSS